MAISLIAAPSVSGLTAVTATAGLTTPSITGLQDDVILVMSSSEDNAYPLNTPTNSGTALTWVPIFIWPSLSSSSPLGWWAAKLPASQTFTITATSTGAASSRQMAIIAWQFRGAEWIGQVFANNFATGTMQVSGARATRAGSRYVFAATDWGATSGTGTYFTNAGAFTTVFDGPIGTSYGVRSGSHGVQAVENVAVQIGMSTPTTAAAWRGNVLEIIEGIVIPNDVAPSGLILPRHMTKRSPRA